MWHSLNLPWLESLYETFESDVDSVPPSWQRRLRALDDGTGGPWRPQHAAPPPLFGPSPDTATAQQQHALDALVASYRTRGHEAARLDPLGRKPDVIDELSPEHWGLGEQARETQFFTDVGEGGVASLGKILTRLQRAYTGAMSADVMHIRDREMRSWWLERIEAPAPEPSADARRRILRALTDAEVFDRLVQRRYLGSKSFSLEGAEVVIPMLRTLLDEAASEGVREIVLGMTHRGRLNVLRNVLDKPAWLIFREFEDDCPEHFFGRGDVKHHLGASTDRDTPHGAIHISLCFNPSHLEVVNAVAMGRLRAKQCRAGDAEGGHGMLVLMHGDAGFAGEGAVQESLNLSGLPSYTTGGTLHLLVDNMLGFTTEAEQARATRHASDIARGLDIPILHVNAADPNAATRCVSLAVAARMRWRHDVLVHLHALRRCGHNEMDEPAFTQPRLYARIDDAPRVRRRYGEDLVAAGVVEERDLDALAKEVEDELEDAHRRAEQSDHVPEPSAHEGHWKPYRGGPEPDVRVATRVADEHVRDLLRALAAVPDDFTPHPKLAKAQRRRRDMADGEILIDWSAAEALALASLAAEGTPVRLTGQDSERGTFSQRHACLHDVETGARYRPLHHVDPNQAPIHIANSPLSELGVLAFEYGYSLDYPEALVCWEAQFGDFVNMAQAITDQFVASAEDKWRRLSGLVLLLPHGFEGQGPEHSSARLERFLALAAEDNLQITQPTTPAQYFHLLRRQALRRWRKPLVVLTPKSLLRRKEVASPIADFAEGTFERVLSDPEATDGPARLLLCTGKVYYDLAQRRRELDRDDVEIIRIEQLYPLSDAALSGALSHIPDGTTTVWVQEEPENMGAWPWLASRWRDALLGRLPLQAVTRAASASPATGAPSAHRREQNRLLDRAFGGTPGSA